MIKLWQFIPPAFVGRQAFEGLLAIDAIAQMVFHLSLLFFMKLLIQEQPQPIGIAALVVSIHGRNSHFG